MSVEAVKEFFEKADTDEALQAQIQEMIEGKEEYGCCAFAALAAEHGFEFTAEEMHDGIEQLRSSEDERELTDEDLENVAGGAGYPSFVLPHFVPGMNTRMVNILYGVSGQRGSMAQPMYGIIPLRH
jgi:predicted ribosomally synthesized peptide with nif11-like leader